MSLWMVHMNSKILQLLLSPLQLILKSHRFEQTFMRTNMICPSLNHNHGPFRFPLSPWLHLQLLLMISQLMLIQVFQLRSAEEVVRARFKPRSLQFRRRLCRPLCRHRRLPPLTASHYVLAAHCPPHRGEGM